jgi:hypothetical protein
VQAQLALLHPRGASDGERSSEPHEGHVVILHLALLVTVLGIAVVFGTDTFFAVVGRRALARTSDAAMVETMGRLHEVGDRRMPLFGAIGLVGTASSALLLPAGRVFAGVALGAQLLWLVLYLTIAKPLNARMTIAARDKTTPRESRDWQTRWDSILVPRAVLMGVALIGAVLTFARAT